MKKLALLFCLLPTSAFSWTIGDVVYLKSGSPAMTVTSILPNTNVGVHWFAGQTMLAATFPENTLAIEVPNPKISHNEAIISKRDNPPDPSPP